MRWGFTLLEILITIIILTVGVIALSQAYSSGLFVVTDIENVGLALNIAQAEMEQIRGKDFSQIVADGDSGPAPEGNFSNFEVWIDIAEGHDPMQVEVIVSWEAKGGQANVALTTLVANY